MFQCCDDGDSRQVGQEYYITQSCGRVPGEGTEAPLLFLQTPPETLQSENAPYAYSRPERPMLLENKYLSLHQQSHRKAQLKLLQLQFQGVWGAKWV